jgi:hypothetical protein
VLDTARGCGGGRSAGEHPALVRSPVPRRRRCDDRACRRARGDGCRACGGAPPCRGRVADDRALSLLRADVRALVPALRALRGQLAPVLI